MFVTVRNKVAKVMFLHVSVILFTGGVCYSNMHCRWYPSMPCSRGCLLPGGASSWGVYFGGMPAPWGLLPGVHGDPHRKQMATVANGTHLTGMHSCYQNFLLRKEKKQKNDTTFKVIKRETLHDIRLCLTRRNRGLQLIYFFVFETTWCSLFVSLSCSRI